MYNKRQNLFQNETKQLKRKINVLEDTLEQFKKRQCLLEKGLKRIAKIQNHVKYIDTLKYYQQSIARIASTITPEGT